MSCEARATRAATGQVVVEMIGTPGAGKSTAADELRSLLRARGVPALSIVEAARPHAARTAAGRVVVGLAPSRLRGPLLWQVFRGAGMVSAARLVAGRSPLLRDVVRSERARQLPAASRRHTLYWFFQLAGRRRFLSRRPAPGEVLVVDDGFLHRSVALHAAPGTPPDLEAVHRYVDAIPAPDLVVAVRAAPETCVRRILARGLWRHRAGMTEAELTRYVDHAAAVVATAIERARSLGWPVVDVDNDGDGLEGLRGQLHAAVREVRS